jgi:prepilin-type N-terminal cleavage/methylation domain-containing protein
MNFPQNQIIKKKNGFTMLEMMVAIAIIVVIVAIAVPAINSSRADSNNAQAAANSKVINDAIQRAYITKGDTNPAIYGPTATNVQAAVIYLYGQGYIQ